MEFLLVIYSWESASKSKYNIKCLSQVPKWALLSDLSWSHLTFEYLSEVISLLAKDNVETGVNTPVQTEMY